MNTRLNLNDIASYLSRRAGIDYEEAENFIKGLFAVATEGVATDGTATINGLGTFVATGNPDSPIDFVPDEKYAEEINAPFALFEPTELGDNVTEEMLVAETGSETGAVVTGETSGEEVAKEEEKVIETEEEERNIESAETRVTPTPPPYNPPVPEVTEEKKPIEASIPTAAPEAEERPNTTPVHTALPDEEAPVEYARPTLTMGGERKERKCCRTLCYLIVILLIVAAYFAGLYTPKIVELINTDKSAPTVATATPEKEVVDNEAAVPTRRIEEPDPDIISETEEAESIEEETATEAAEGKMPVSTPEAIKTDTVRVKYYITHMAKKYYGNDNFWPYIYKENEAILGHPDLTQPGTVVVIPAASKYNIDANNPESVAAAKKLGGEIYKKYK